MQNKSTGNTASGIVTFESTAGSSPDGGSGRRLVSARSKPGRAFSINNRACHCDVSEVPAGLLHSVTSIRRGSCRRDPTKSTGNRSRSPKLASKTFTYFPVAMLPRRMISLATGQFSCENTRVSLNRRSKTRIVTVNIDRCEFTQVIETNPRSGIDKPTSGRDHKHTGYSGRRPRERRRVCNLAAKVEAAEKGEHLRDRRAAFAAQFSREFEFRPVAQYHPRSFPTGERR